MKVIEATFERARRRGRFASRGDLFAGLVQAGGLAATSEAQRASAHGHALRAVQVAELACDAFDHGECNAAELIVALRCLRRVADALGEAGAAVRAVLERTASYRLARGLADAPAPSF